MKISKIDELTRWIERETKLLSILEGKISNNRLLSWSDIMKKGWINPGYYKKDIIPPNIVERYDLIDFIVNEASNLSNEHPDQVAILNNNHEHLSVKDSKDPMVTAIICGIRSLQEKKTLKGVINFVRYREYQGKLRKLIKENGDPWLNKLKIERENYLEKVK